MVGIPTKSSGNDFLFNILYQKMPTWAFFVIKNLRSETQNLTEFFGKYFLKHNYDQIIDDY